MRMFRDRRDAGRQLAQKLSALAAEPDLLVLALPRGGVPVGYEVARALGAELDVFLVRKLGVPGHRELALGAIASGGVRALNEDIIQSLRLSDGTIETVTAEEQRVLERRERVYRSDRPRPAVRNRPIILVDDGLATGASMRAAIAALRQQGPRHIIAAVPVGPPETCREMDPLVDEFVCLITPHSFQGVGQWYEDFSQTSDDEVRELLACAAAETSMHGNRHQSSGRDTLRQ